MAAKKAFTAGDLVWIPAHTPLMFYLPRESHEFAWRSIEQKEPTYGLVLERGERTTKVLIGEQQLYVLNKDIYGEKNDY